MNSPPKRGVAAANVASSASGLGRQQGAPTSGANDQHASGPQSVGRIAPATGPRGHLKPPIRRARARHVGAEAHRRLSTRRARRWWTARRAQGWDGRTGVGAGLRDRGAVESAREPDSGAWCAASSPRGGRRTAAALPERSAHPAGRQRIAQTRAPSPDATSAERRARCRRIGSSSGPAGSPARPRRPRRPGLSPASPAQPRPAKSALETAKRADGRTEGTGSEAQLQDWGAVETTHLGDSYAWCAGTSRRGDPPAEGGPGGVCGGELAEPERRLRGLKGICTGGARNQRHDCWAAGLLGLIKAGGAVCVRR